MREPLNQFAARIARSGELNEFLEGLCDEHGVSPDTIMRIGKLLQSRGRAVGRDGEQAGGHDGEPSRHEPDAGRDAGRDAGHFATMRAQLENELRQGLLPLTHNAPSEGRAVARTLDGVVGGPNG